MKQLQRETSIQILAADKGRATVIMDITEYDEKLANMLNDTATYAKLNLGGHSHQTHERGKDQP